MQKETRDKICNIGYEIGLKSKYLENKNNVTTILNYIKYNQFEDFIETMLMISLETKIQLPAEIVDYKVDRQEYIKIANLFLLGLNNGSIKSRDKKIKEIVEG